MTLRDRSDCLSFLAERLLLALQASGDDGLALDEVDGLDIPMPDWRLNELRAAGHVIGEDHGRLHLIHSPASTEPPAAASPQAVAHPSARPAGGSVDAGQLPLEAA